MKVKIMLLLLFIICMEALLKERSEVSFLNVKDLQTEAFREQELSAELYAEIMQTEKSKAERMELLTETMLDGKFYPYVLSEEKIEYQKYKKEEYDAFLLAYKAIWGDIQYFPVAGQTEQIKNSWMDKRNFKGEHLHEGIDVFGKKNESFLYPIISMTDGKVEKIGWLTLGGYRIGIRTPSGGYFYYAHLSGYEKSFKIGDSVEAGDVLGYMGNTGYGTEGTKGLFPVHLHLGIYIETPDRKELSVNPYWILKAMEKYQIGNTL